VWWDSCLHCFLCSACLVKWGPNTLITSYLRCLNLFPQLTNSLEQSASWEANMCSASREIPRKFVTAFVRACHLSLFWDRSSPCPSPTSWSSISIFFPRLLPSLPNGLLSSGCPTRILYAPLLFPHLCYMPRPSNSSWYYRLNLSYLPVTEFNILHSS